MDENLKRALEALEGGAREARAAAAGPSWQLRALLRRAVEDVVARLEEETRAEEGSGDDIVSQLDRKSKGIADDLRRAERLMREKNP